MANRDNFAAIVSEGLTAEQRDRLMSGDMGVQSIWDMVIESHVLVLEPPMFVRKADKKLISKEAFTNLYTPLTTELNIPARYKDAPVTWARKDYNLQRATQAIYEPGQPDVIGNTFNMWRRPAFEPLEGKPEIILQHIEYLIPNRRERRLFWDYLKWMVQHPDKKIQFALLIIGQYGVGKSWLAGLFSALFGPENMLLIEKGERATAKFNKDMANRQVIFIDEIVPDGKQDLVKAIAPIITAPTMTVEPKGVDAFQIPNRSNIIGISNYENAVRLQGRQDRRWLVIRATDDLYGADDSNRPTAATKAYYDRLFALTPKDGTVTDEVRRLAHFLKTRPLNMSGEFSAQGVAPMTGAKDDVAEATESDIESAVQGAYVDKSGPFRFELVTLEDVRAALVRNDARKVKAIQADVGAAMKAAGCRRLDMAGQVYLPGKHKPRRVWIAHKSLAAKYGKMEKKQLAAAYAAERAGKPKDPPADSMADFEEGDGASSAVH
jgi:Family of unknown function (DUF5906)